MDSKNPISLRTIQEARAMFEASGVSITEWAKEQGFDRDVVYAVLAGRTRGSRGQAHKVAVALKIKASVPMDTSTVNANHESISETNPSNREDFAMSP